MNLEPELIADYACVVGEGPLWHPDEKKVYWVDIGKGRLFRYEPASGKHEMVCEGEPIGGFTIQEDGALLCFMSKGAVRLWRNGHFTTLLESIPGEEGSRFNDVIADPAGRVFCGTMPTGDVPGTLYRLDTDGSLHKVIDRDVRTSNGAGFTPDRKQMYYTESGAKKIYRFDYDQATGALSNRHTFVDRNNEPGVPDGMTVDAEGNVWSGIWDGGCLIRYAPDGSETLRIPFPARKVSCVTFGGDDYSDLYITLAGGDKKETDGALAGSLVRLRLGIQGVPEFRSKIVV